MSVCGGLRRLLCWVAEQLAEGRTKKKKLASFRRGPIPVRVPWGISPNWSGAPKMVQRRYRGLRLLLTERCCEMRSARGGQSHSMLA